MISVFDTNAYRGLVSGVALEDVADLANQLCAVEKAKGIAGMMCTITAEELLSHLLDDESSRDYISCIKASVLCYRHCKEDVNHFRMLPNPEAQIAMEYFGKRNHKAIQTQETVGQVLSLIDSSPTHETVVKHTDVLQKIKSHVVGAEMELIDQIQNYGKQIDPSFSNWGFFVADEKNRKKYLSFIKSKSFEEQTAAAFLCAVAMELESQGIEISLEPGEVKMQIQAYISSYQAALSIRRFFFEQLTNPGFDLTTNSRANYLWDEQILYFVGHQSAGEKVLLVTSDKKMLDAAAKTGYGSDVMSLSEYKVFLGL